MKAFTYAASVAALMAAVVTAAAPASAQIARVRVGDLNTADPAAARVLEQRIDRAAWRLCRRVQAANRRIGDQEACRAGVREQVAEALAERDALAQSPSVRRGA